MSEEDYWKLQEILSILDKSDKATLIAVNKYIEARLKEID